MPADSADWRTADPTLRPASRGSRADAAAANVPGSGRCRRITDAETGQREPARRLPRGDLRGISEPPVSASQSGVYRAVI